MNEEQKYELELPTIRDIELQIWKIGRYGKNPEAQLEACRFLLERIEAREKAERGVSEIMELVNPKDPKDTVE